MKKLVFVLPKTYPYFNHFSGKMAGGAELQFYLLSTELAKKKNYSISFIVGDFGQKKTENINNIKIIKSFNSTKGDSYLLKLKQAFLFMKILFKEKPDVILSTSNNTLVVLCSLYTIFSKAKHIHRIAHNNDVNLIRMKEYGFLGKAYAWGMKKSNKILVQNTEQQEQLLKNYRRNSVLFKNAFIIEPSNNLKRKYLLWVSRYKEWKQPELFLKLADKFKSNQFLMICPSSDLKNNGWVKLKKMASSLDNLKFIDYIPYSEIQSYFNEAIIFINTSRTEGFPNTFLQAAQAKAPIVSLNTNPNDFITKFDCGFFSINSFEEMVANIDYLLNNKKSLAKKGENCFKYLQQNHDLKIISKQLENLINEVQ